MKTFVATPHDINIISGARFVPEKRKWVGGEVISTIPASGKMLNVVFGKEQVHVAEDGIPEIFKEVVSIDPLPEGYDRVVVSAMYASKYVAKFGADKRLYIVSDPVLEDDGTFRTTKGCRGLSPFCK